MSQEPVSKEDLAALQITRDISAIRNGHSAIGDGDRDPGAGYAHTDRISDAAPG